MALSSTSGRQMTKPKRAGLKFLFGVGFLVLLSAGGLAFNMWLQPQRHADVQRCLSTERNSCDFDIVAAYCYDLATAVKTDDVCQTQTLSPGDAFTAFSTASFDGKTYWMACKAPFVPAWVPTTHNRAQLVKGCRDAQ